MVEFEINVTELAENDLRDIATYIGSHLHEPNAALNTNEVFEAKIDSLKRMALAYPIVGDDYLASIGYRLMPVKNYHVFYIAYEKEKLVDVDRILYNRRNWNYILLGSPPVDHD
ncbi:MAG: type II toxin-antitoxin system RelE/ParE family toxin [Oscillospiraceae bacterium]|nr:type II toxin-antitoxin system RelE/ParE family toxin [Oscillospiraceae bacterium]